MKENANKSEVSSKNLTTEDLEVTPELQAFLSQYNMLSTDGFLVRPDSFKVVMMDLVDKSKMLAFKFGELSDAVILGLAGTVGVDKGGIKIRFLSQIPMIRMQKHQIAITSLPPHNLLLPYLQQSSDRFDSLPGFFNFERKIQVETVIKILKEANEKYPVTIANIKADPAASEQILESDRPVTVKIKSNYRH
jgi:hypothetical protein